MGWKVKKMIKGEVEIEWIDMEDDMGKEKGRGRDWRKMWSDS